MRAAVTMTVILSVLALPVTEPAAAKSRPHHAKRTAHHSAHLATAPRGPHAGDAGREVFGSSRWWERSQGGGAGGGGGGGGGGGSM
jgi:hypothetical protein